MADVFSKAQRSAVMARIRSRGNARTELALARRLRAHGLTGWRRHLQIRIADFGQRNVTRPEASRPARRSTGPRAPMRGRPLAVRPDFVFRAARLAVFVDGCFWHGCPRHGTQPRGNAAFWRRKITGNRARDGRVDRALRRAGWRVLRIWEHALARKHEARLMARLRRALEKEIEVARRRQRLSRHLLPPSAPSFQPG